MPYSGPDRNCVICSAVFTPLAHNASVCSRDCKKVVARRTNKRALKRFHKRHPEYEAERYARRKKLHNLKRSIKRWAQNLKELKKCIICGSGFRSSRAKLKICSEECVAEAKRRRVNAFHARNPHVYPSKKKEKKQRTPMWADMGAIKFFYECRPMGCHVDHIIPLRGEKITGLHVETNLQWLPGKENLRKGNRF